MENQAGWPDDQASTTVVTLPGEVSYYNATQVHEELTAALEPGVTTVILDLTLTTFSDSTGLSKIADARRPASTYRIDLRVVVPPPGPARRATGPRAAGRGRASGRPARGVSGSGLR